MPGWDYENFKNASGPILWGHNSYAPPIGSAAKLKKTKLDGYKALIGDVTLAEAEVNPDADLIYRLVEAGFIKTGSVGFESFAILAST